MKEIKADSTVTSTANVQTNSATKPYPTINGSEVSEYGFNEKLVEYSDYLRANAHFVCYDTRFASVEDYIQEHLLRCVASRNIPISRFTGHFCRTPLKCASINYYHKHGRMEVVSQTADEWAGMSQDASPTVQLTAHDIEEMLKCLTNDERQIVEYRLVLDLTFEEIAQGIGQPLGTIKPKFGKAMEKLRGYLRADEVLAEFRVRKV